MGHQLMTKALAKANEGRFAANRALQELTIGGKPRWLVEGSVLYAAELRHEAYEMWDTAEIAEAALKECYQLRKNQ